MEFLNVGGTRWEDLVLSDDVVHMGHNCNHLDLDPAINEAMLAAIKDDQYRNYTPPSGFEELRALIKSDVGVAECEVMVTQGATEAIYQAMAAILKPGDQTIVSDPGWPHIANFARSLGSEVIEIPIYGAPNAKLTAEIVAEHVTPRTRLITLIDPLNPLGSSYDEDDIRALCRVAGESGSYFLHDATYKDFAAHGHFPAIRYYDRAVMNISLSKICGFAGLRVGATLAPRRLLHRIAEHQVARLGGNWVAQRGAIAAYRTKKNWVSKVLERHRKNQSRLQECIAKVEGLRPVVQNASGNFVCVDVTGSGFGAEDIVRAALNAGFVIRSGDYTSKRFGNDFVRITTTIPDEDIERFCDVFPGVMARLKGSDVATSTPAKLA